MLLIMRMLGEAIVANGKFLLVRRCSPLEVEQLPAGKSLAGAVFPLS